MIRSRFAAPALAAVSLGACAHGGPPEAVTIPTEKPANARAMLYAACARAEGPVGQLGRYVRLSCTGAPAKALFDEAAAFSRNRARETVEGSVTIRRIGAEAWFDACRHDATSGAYSCFVHLLAPAGFLDPENDVPPQAKAK